MNPVGAFIRACLNNRLVVVLLTLGVMAWGILVAPFDWDLGIQRDPVPVDAIPDLGENQQIVFTEWMGRSPQDVEDQITYPLTVSLMGIPGVKTIRSYSYFGFSTVYVIFEEDIEFYWSRSRILEKLNSLPRGTLPGDAQPTLGPDATALGQIFWYTLEGRDRAGNPTGGWDLQELRSIQDWYVRYGLQSADGVSEVASVGGHVREYQIDVDPDAMRAHGVTLEDVFTAVRSSNVDVGARTIEVNRVEYFIRGLGFLESAEDIAGTVVKVRDNTPITIGEVAHVQQGPALRRGVLDKEGAEAVGGVVVVRYGENPMAAIKAVKAKIEEIAPGLPQKTLPDGTVSQVTIVPFYDRSGLIAETLETLNTALVDEILVTILVVLLMVVHLRSSLVISAMLPVTVLMTFIGMKQFGVDANIVALSGIAIAIGTIVDMGIVMTENILRHLRNREPGADYMATVLRASSEVGGAVLTAVLTTVVSFLPVFTLEAAEGKLFQPLAYTKTFALVAAAILAIAVIPVAAGLLFRWRADSRPTPESNRRQWWINLAVVVVVGLILTWTWLPLGPGRSLLANLIFVTLLIGGIMIPLFLFQRHYARILGWCLDHKKTFLTLPAALLLFGAFVWLGFAQVMGFIPGTLRTVGLNPQGLVSSAPWVAASHAFPGLGKEFMPNLDEGSFLYMPTTMPHASTEEALDVLQKLDQAIYAVPEVERVVGKIGRVESALDPAPMSMVETVVNYKSEYGVDEDGNRVRNWRDHIHDADDIWDAIVKAANLPGTTSAPKLQPIAARLVMLQSGMRAPMGIKIKGPDLETIEAVGLEMERHLKRVPGVKAAAVFADRIVGKPYLEIDLDRAALARYGLSVRQVQDVIEVAVGGRALTSTVEGRERYAVRVRYPRELRSDMESLENILVASPTGAQIPMVQLADIRYLPGPQVIKSEDTFLVGYVLFDKEDGYGEVDVVEAARDHFQDLLDTGEFALPPGVSYSFAGNYEAQVRSQKKLQIVLPLALFIIFLILYFQFRRVPTTLMVFSGIFVAWSGGLTMIWLYGQEWFLAGELAGVSLRELFQMGPLNLSVAVWVGFLALFGIATDDGVIMATYLDQSFKERKPGTRGEVREAVIRAGRRRIRPALMTAGTTILALVPVLTSTGRGSDVMVPMAIPSFGGMCFVLLTVLVVPVLYGLREEQGLKSSDSNQSIQST